MENISFQPRFQNLFVFLFGLILLLRISLAASAHAAAPTAIRQVAPGGSDSGSCVGSPCATIAYALDQSVNGDTIQLSPGSYTGAFTVDVDVEIVGAGQGLSFIQAATAPGIAGTGVVTITAETTAGFQDLSIRFGRAVVGEPFGGGGGINNAGALTVSTTSIYSNTAVIGGGIYNSGVLTVTGSTITGNTGNGIHNSSAGSMYMTGSEVSYNDSDGNGGGVSFAASSPYSEIDNSSILHNTADSNGGGVYAGSNSDIWLGQVILSFNSAASGGGLYTLGFAGVGYSTVEGNTASLSGGGFYASQNWLGINHSMVISNTAPSGGGMYFFSGTGDINTSTFAGNSATSLFYGGGGITIWNGGDVKVENSTISGNSADFNGGGAYVKTGDLFLTNVTLVSNQATSGGGIYNEDNLTMSNSIVLGNLSANSLDDCDLTEADIVDLLSANLVGQDTGCPSSAGVITSSNPAAEFELVLKDNGGPTWTHALVPGSQAVDAGLDNCMNSFGWELDEDQRGVSRPLDGDGDEIAVCDLGAYESPIITDRIFLPIVVRDP